MFPSFDLFGKEISMYALMSILGMLIAGFVFCKRIARAGEDDNEAILFLLVLCLGIVTGGPLLFALTNLSRFPSLFEADSTSERLSILASLFGGMVFYGGLIGAYILGRLYLRWRRLNKALYMDTAALCAPLFHAFARIGCFFGGCCYGVPSGFGFCAQGNTVTDIGDIRRFPVQLLESSLDLLIVLLVYLILRKKRFTGKVFYLYLILCAVARFFDEFLRGDAVRGFLLGLSTSQFISILVFLYAGAVLVRYAFRERRTSVS